ncbi:MAG: universal stress protein [Clostridiales bacterium]|nr:universal stress protein [Clostridiales bacterium]
MKTILVPIDGSENSKRAMLKAKELADCLGSKIIIMNVMNIVTTVSIYPNLQSAKTGGSVDWPGIYDAAKERSEKLLGEAKELLKGSDVETVMIDDPSGKFATAIVNFANERDVDLIVMGSNGMGSLRHRLYLGSVTTKVLHMTEKAVMVIQ